MNIYFSVAFAVLIGGACIASGIEGHKIGKESQQAADQKQFDQYNQAVVSQKIQAAAILADANAANLKLATDRDNLKTQLGKAHEAASIATNSLRTQLAGSSLRFTADKDSGCGDGGASPADAKTDTASAPTTPAVRLPDATSRTLLTLAFEADQLADSYRECYGWAQSVK